MTVNMGSADRIIRAIVGVVLLALVFVGPQTPWLDWHCTAGNSTGGKLPCLFPARHQNLQNKIGLQAPETQRPEQLSPLWPLSFFNADRLTAVSAHRRVQHIQHFLKLGDHLTDQLLVL